MIGEKFGQYEIVEVVGQGGMATVYRAYQSTMDRYVALKILPRQLSEDPTFLKRFQQEALTIARLEHRSIVPVYDYGEIGKMPYIVMRLIDGGTVRRKIYHNELPLDLTARIIEQVGSALDYAHSHGVIHRDLKPSNILLDRDNNAYLTDFGIAKMLGATSQITDQSGVIGTPSYMSPEQCQGKPVSAASDIYSLGAIVFEMITGQTPFQADTPLSVMYMQVKDPVPSVRAYEPDLPDTIDDVIKRAMSKAPLARYKSAAALASDFWRAIAAPVDPAIPVTVRPIYRQPDLYEGDAEVVSEGYTGYQILDTGTGFDEPTAGRSALRSKFPRRPSQLALAGIFGGMMLLSLIGIGVIGASWLQESQGGDGEATRLAVLAQTQTRQIIPTNTAFAVTATPAASETIIAGGGPESPTPTVTVGLILSPTFLPAQTTLPPLPTTARPPATATATRPLPTATSVQPTATFTLTSQPTATPTTAITPTQTSVPSWTGGRVAFTRGNLSAAEIYIMDDNGANQIKLTTNSFYDGEPDFSPDGTQIAFESDQTGVADTHLYVMNDDGTGRIQLTTADAPNRHPDWRPAGDLIVFESGRNDDAEIYVIEPDGTGLTRLTTNDYGDRAPRFSPDGTQIAFMTDQRGKWEIALMAYPSGTVTKIFDCPASDCRFPAWSPDGKQLVYNTLVGVDADDIYVVDVQSGLSTLKVEGNESGRPVWAGNGVFIFFSRFINNSTNIYRLNLTNGIIETITTNSGDSYGPDWR